MADEGPFRLSRVESPVGTILLVWDEAEWVCALDFFDHEPRLRRLLARYHGRAETREAPAPAFLCDAVGRYFAGEFDALATLPLRPAGTPFQARVWTALAAIPAGTTESYAGLARRIGSPAAVRAVGLANGANPVAIAVPCHRVIGSGGALTGYGGGLERKRWLLAHEGTMLREPGRRRPAGSTGDQFALV